MRNMKEQKAVLEQMVADLLIEARKQGADTAEAAVSKNDGLNVNVRMGQVETIEHVNDQGLGVTVYFGKRRGSASTTDFSNTAIRDTVEAACKIARYTQEDPCSGLAEAELMATEQLDLDLYHPWDLNAEQAIKLALECENAARAVDSRITNSDGAAVDSHEGLHVYGNSHGFVGGYPRSKHVISCAVLGQTDTNMQRDYWWTVGRTAQKLENPTVVGRVAAERTLARLGARQVKTTVAPVVFQADVAVRLLGNLLSAISGGALYRQASFLLEHINKKIFPDFVNILENPHIPQGFASSAFDNEGVATQARDLVKDGVLCGYMLDSYAARKLGMSTTGNAGGAHNLIVAPGELDREALRRSLGTGLWITALMGQGVNIVTGDYSRGATGFWIENGEIAYPVEEVTVAGNLKDMFLGLQAIGKDVDVRSSILTGSWLLSPMTIAGA